MIEKLGGQSKLKELVAFMPTVFLLRDRAGKLWYIHEERMLTEEETQYIIETYDEIYAANNNPQVAALHASNWRKALTQSEANLKQLSTSLAELTRHDGSFDLERFQELAGGLKAQRRLPREACDPTERIAYCAYVLHGGIPDYKQATQGGYIQRYSQYGRR